MTEAEKKIRKQLVSKRKQFVREALKDAKLPTDVVEDIATMMAITATNLQQLAGLKVVHNLPQLDEIMGGLLQVDEKAH